MTENQHLKKIRISKLLTQEEISKLIGISKSYYSKVESGSQNPSYKFMKKLKKKFPEINIDALFFSK